VDQKIFTREALVGWVAEQRLNGHKVGFTCGAFDILHAGHVDYLERSRRHCDRLIVAVNSDASVRAYKSALRPVNPENNRMLVVAALESVDAVILMPETHPAALMELLKPDVYIKGGDYKADQLESKALVESYGGQVLCIPVAFETSTSATLERAAAIQMHATPPELGSAGLARLAFLDRDGTLIRDIPFLHDPTRVELMPGVPAGLKRLQEVGFTLVIVSNQQGIGLGYYNESDFIEVNRELFRQLAPAGVRISRVYYCPHSYADECECRKPGSLLLENALKHYEAPARRCCFIGDSPTDCVAAERVGCPSVLISSGACPAPCTHNAASFQEAVTWILQNLN